MICLSRPPASAQLGLELCAQSSCWRHCRVFGGSVARWLSGVVWAGPGLLWVADGRGHSPVVSRCGSQGRWCAVGAGCCGAQVVSRRCARVAPVVCWCRLPQRRWWLLVPVAAAPVGGCWCRLPLRRVGLAASCRSRRVGCWCWVPRRRVEGGGLVQVAPGWLLVLGAAAPGGGRGLMPACCLCWVSRRQLAAGCRLGAVLR